MVTNQITDHNSVSLQSREASYFFPLYLYPESSEQQTLDGVQVRTPNLSVKIVNQMEDGLGLTFVPEKDDVGNFCLAHNPLSRKDYKETFAPIDLLDYIYAILHSPSYRENYKEFLKVDFPRVPYPEDKEKF